MTTMSKVGYRFRTNDKSWSDIVLEEAVRSAWASRLRPFDGPFHQRAHGERFGPYRPLKDAVDKAAHDLTQGDVGFLLFVANKDGKGVRGRRIEYEIKLAVTTGNANIDLLFTDILQNFNPGVQNMGALVCKTVGTTSTPSQHSAWSGLTSTVARQYGFASGPDSAGGNAIDAGHSSRQRLDDMFYYYIHRADQFHLQDVIHWPTQSAVPLIWNPEGGIHRYYIPSGGSDHKFHVHFDLRPYRPFDGSHSAC